MAGSVMLTLLLLAGAVQTAPPSRAHAPAVDELFTRSTRCIACHNGITGADGTEVSIASGWRASMMANSARDPYWQASVRRETLDHPAAAAAIENECSACHMPMTRFASKAAGRKESVFANTVPSAAGTIPAMFAADGVSCSLCHQITARGLGERTSFTAGFDVDRATPQDQRAILGPYDVDEGRTKLMHSASMFQPQNAVHVQSSELCATCHTLYTHALKPDGSAAGELPEQVPYLEWRHSAFLGEKSCQACHMPVVAAEAPITSVMGRPRTHVSQHEFRGGNAFMLQLISDNGAALGAVSPAAELRASAHRTIEHLQTEAARLEIRGVTREGGRLRVDVAVTNLAGHKLPTAYPSRRAWVHFTVREASGGIVFESGKPLPSGAIEGNDNDLSASDYERHHRVIREPDDVQIYEAVLGDHRGEVTTGLISAVRYLKDNRLLPRGFEKTSAGRDIAVQGDAVDDPDFVAAGDTVRYLVTTPSTGPLVVEAELLYEPIGYRWAENLRATKSAESERFLPMYDQSAPRSATLLARARAAID